MTSELVANLTNLPESVYVTMSVTRSEENEFNWFRDLSSQGGAVQRYTVLPNKYNLKIRDSGAALTVQSIDCSVASTVCTFPDQIAATLIVDLTGVPENVIIELISGVNTFRSIRDAGGIRNQFPVLALSNITVRATVSYYITWEFSVSNIDCSTGVCSAGNMTSEIVLDLSNDPEDVSISIYTGTGTGIINLRSVVSQGGAVQRYNVLCDAMYGIDVFSSSLLRSYKIDKCVCGGACVVTRISV
jgi:hypothetical protein